jgi:hypothetical protein
MATKKNTARTSTKTAAPGARAKTLVPADRVTKAQAEAAQAAEAMAADVARKAAASQKRMAKVEAARKAQAETDALEVARKAADSARVKAYRLRKKAEALAAAQAPAPAPVAAPAAEPTTAALAQAVLATPRYLAALEVLRDAALASGDNNRYQTLVLAIQLARVAK